MSTMEIALLVTGVIIFVLSFLIPDKKKDKDQAGVDAQDIRQMVETELGGMKLQVKEATDETVEYAMERAERQLERVSNEKIMALSEYADTIMEGIDKSHQEVLFMYDMLTDKQTDLKNTVRKAEATVREVESAQPVQVQPVEQQVQAVPVMPETPQPVFVQQASAPESEFARLINESHTVEEFIQDDAEEEGNNNERILALADQGLSTVDIARELGLGVGEVKLVVDLFKG
ncbi:MAG: hypothetical protein J5518_02610 [Lachnospiraceae bacterium]|nr:hypothetical protein [Lachnospiraceae bacterium]